MAQKIAIIDLGTSSTKLLIFEVRKNGEINNRHRERIESHLGKGMEGNGGKIFNKNIENNLAVIRSLIEKSRDFKAEKIKIVSTEVLRKAKNAEVVVQKIAEAVGIKPIIVSQVREAQLFWKGATADFPENMEIAAIDVGGGSVEFMWGTRDRLAGHKLAKTGAFYLKEILGIGDKFSEDNVREIENLIRQELDDVDIKFSPETPYIHGTSAVIDFYREARVPLEPYPHSRSHPYMLDLKHTREFYERSQKMTTAERIKLNPSLPGFAEAAVFGLANVLLFAEKTGLAYELPSNNNITHGIVRAMIEGEDL